MVKPISPNEIVPAKMDIIPDAVIEIFNREIALNFTGRRSQVIQDQIVPIIAGKMDCHCDHVFKSGWLNIEEIYREQGWAVAYYKPSYHESGSAYWTFTVK